jgi:predicted lipoprotein
VTSLRISLGCAVALVLALALPAGATVKASDVIQPAIDGFVRPAYAALHDAASSMAAGMKVLCSAPSPASLDAARETFSGLVGAWSHVEMIRFGPVSEGNRLERMLFWPDRKGTGLRQVQAALADKDESVTDPSRLAEKSVALQGLGALEFLLHGTGAETLTGTSDRHRCLYGQAVAANVESMSADIASAWNSSDGFASVWAHPGPDNPLYRDGAEAVTELMGVFINGLEMVRDVRLKGFFGKNAGADRPKQAIYWRSSQTTSSLAANLAGLDRLFAASQLGQALSPEARWMAQSAHIQFVNGAADAGAVTGSIDAALSDPARRARLDHFSLVTSTLSELFGTRMTAEFGLTAGFSSLDGD